MAGMEPTKHLADRELVSSCLAGDNEARRMLYTQNVQRVYAMALRLTGSVSDAEDVVQETFIKAFRSLPSFRQESALGTWLCRIAINLCRDLFKRRSRFESEDKIPEAEHSGGLFAERPKLLAALEKLPDGYREVLVMHDVLGMEHNEMAEVLGVHEGTSKSQLHKARARMRELLSGEAGA